MGSEKYKAVILPEAENDILEVMDYISNELSNPTAAKNLWLALLDAVERVSMYPYAMPLVKNKKLTLGKEYRRVEVEHFVAIYKIVEEVKEIRIFAFLYAPSNIINHILNRL